jgi:hypothetical protein
MSFDPSMKTMLQALVTELESCLPSLEANRWTIPIANDCYEAACYWCDLGRWVLESNTRVNYPERARAERMLLAEIQAILVSKPIDEQKVYAPVLKAGGELIEIVGSVQPPVDGHLGFLRIVRELFSFLRTDLHFKEMATEPTSIRFSSGVVYIEMNGPAHAPWFSCSFGVECQKPHDFQIQDLLYLNRDERYKTLPERLDMNTEAAIEEWFEFLAGIFKQYGSPVFENRPGVFEALAAAQAERDAAYVREMEIKFGDKGSSSD